MQDREILEQILAEAKKLSKLVGISVTTGLGSSDRICLLDQAGLSNKEIAETLGISTNLVSSTLYNAKKKKSTKTTGK